MAILWLDGFESYGTTIGGPPSPAGIIGRSYPVALNESAYDIEIGRYGNRALEITSYLDYIQTRNLTTDDTLVFGVAFRIPVIPNTQQPLVRLYSGVNAGLEIRMETNGTLSVYLSFTKLGTTANAVTVDTWHFLEFKVFTNNTTGRYEIRVNNAVWLIHDNVDTQIATDAYHSAIRLGAMFAVNVHWDDLYVLDSTGTGGTDFLGSRQIKLYSPDGDGDTNDWTPLSGNNYENVDEAESDGDTSYNETNTPNDVDLYDYADATDLTTIDAIKISSDIRVDMGSMDIKTLIKSDGTTSEGPAETITSNTFVNQYRISEEDPNTSAAWTQGGLNAAQFGVKAETT